MVSKKVKRLSHLNSQPYMIRYIYPSHLSLRHIFSPSQVIFEFGHTATLRDGVDLSVPGVATHDWEVTSFLEL